MQQVFLDLKTSCFNLEEHQKFWANNLHIFPSNWIPPMRLDSNLAIKALKPEFKQMLDIAEIRMNQISNLLYLKKIPQPQNNSMPIEALELFEASEMQKILSENPL